MNELLLSCSRKIETCMDRTHTFVDPVGHSGSIICGIGVSNRAGASFTLWCTQVKPIAIIILMHFLISALYLMPEVWNGSSEVLPSVDGCVSVCAWRTCACARFPNREHCGSVWLNQCTRLALKIAPFPKVFILWVILCKCHKQDNVLVHRKTPIYTGKLHSFEIIHTRDLTQHRKAPVARRIKSELDIVRTPAAAAGAQKNAEQEKSFPLVTWHSGEVLQHWGTVPSWSSSPQTQIQTFKYPHADEGCLPGAGSFSTSQQKSDAYSILVIRTDAGRKLFVQFNFDHHLKH